MADRLLRSRAPKGNMGLKQPNDVSMLQGPKYPEAQGKSSNMWSEGTPAKKTKSFVRG